MKKRWKVMLILVAVICFGISLSYPLKYKMEEKSTEATMEKLVELRDAGLAKRGGRGDGRQSKTAEEAEGAEVAEATEATEATEAGKESAEESGLPVENGQPEGTAPSDLEGEAERAVEAAAQSEPEGAQSEAAEASEQGGAEASEEAQQAQPGAAESQPGEASEPSEVSETSETEEQAVAVSEASETEEQVGEAEATLEQPSTAEAQEPSEEEAEPGEAEAAPSEAEATLEQPNAAEAQEPSEAEATQDEAEATQSEAEVTPGEAKAEPEGAAETQEQAKEQSSGGAAQVLPGATKRTFATPVPGPTPVPTPTSMPTPTPEPTATPTPGPTVNRFERSGAVPYEKLTKRTLDESKILPEFQEIYAENHDFAGWLTIPDTAIDYPVVQTEDNDYYLHRDFFGEKNANGQIILDSKCDPYTPSYNLVVSGHSMRSGKMFGRLVNYMNESYWESHKLVYFDTLMEERTYEVFAAFFSADYDVDETGFRYNADIQYSVDAKNWLREIEENKLYDTGVDVKFGDEFLTLTTCNKAHRSDGRFVVVCRRLREGEEVE